MKKTFKILVAFILLGQLVFLGVSPRFTAPRFEGRIYATIAARSTPQTDLHKLNEAAHYFGQTIIGWTQFPNFLGELQKKTGLPGEFEFSAHMQERQNLVFTLDSAQSLTQAHLDVATDFLQNKLISYNRASHTGFAFTNLDYEIVMLTRSYLLGASFAFIFSLTLGFSVLYLKKIK